ncbi:biotin transporter BioY [Anaerolentibacter hominis]|uniref:biotin transporter BioY n=1 Tax=Anaerolentibacter hominis TaxID=3079009 RepID=UPI0031B8902D
MKEKTLTKSGFKTKELVLCALFTALTAIGAFIQIPVPNMDYFTLQFFFVLMAGMLLGAKLGAISTAVYVLLGLAGVPIFAAGGGISYVFRPSFGYLLGFILAAFVTGFILERTSLKGTAGCLTAAFAGLLICYGVGLVYKYIILNSYMDTPTPWSVVLLSCFPLDLPGDIVLCILASLLGVRLRPVIRRGI